MTEETFSPEGATKVKKEAEDGGGGVDSIVTDEEEVSKRTVPDDLQSTADTPRQVDSTVTDEDDGLRWCAINTGNTIARSGCLFLDSEVTGDIATPNSELDLPRRDPKYFGYSTLHLPLQK